VDEAFTVLETSFSDCTSYEFELQAYDVVGEMAYTVGLEHTSVSMNGTPRSYTLRATQVYRREGGEWKVAHRHADTVPSEVPRHVRYSARARAHGGHERTAAMSGRLSIRGHRDALGEGPRRRPSSLGTARRLGAHCRSGVARACQANA
jgi:hypothetical protein